MHNMMNSFGESFSLMRRDKYIILFSLVPIFIGIALYTLLGTWAFDNVYTWGMEFFKSKTESSGWLSFLSYIIGALLSIIIILLINWTFVLMVSLMACPFNDLISSRVEGILIGQNPEPISQSISLMLKRAAETLFNEIKKILFIITLSLIGLIINFAVPIIGTAIATIISALLLAVSFLDYSWSRRRLSFKDCIDDMRSSFIPYGLSGAIFVVLIGTPIVNLFALPFGVIYFTVVYTKKHCVI